MFAQRTDASLGASSYSEKWASFLYEYRWGLKPVYPITLRRVTSLFVTLSSQTRPDEPFTIHGDLTLLLWRSENAKRNNCQYLEENLIVSVVLCTTHQNSNFRKFWLDKLFLPSENVQVIKTFLQYFLQLRLAHVLRSHIWSMLILNFSQEIINFTSEIEILRGLTVALSVSWHSC